MAGVDVRLLTSGDRGRGQWVWYIETLFRNKSNSSDLNDPLVVTLFAIWHSELFTDQRALSWLNNVEGRLSKSQDFGGFWFKGIRGTADGTKK